MSNLIKQVGENHYSKMAIQPIEFIHANNIPFIEGSIIKYICRHKSKNGREDLEKAKHLIDILLEIEYDKEHFEKLYNRALKAIEEERKKQI